MKDRIEKFLKWAEDNGWNVKRHQNTDVCLPDNIISRYPSISKEYIEFLKSVNVCIAPDDSSWFLCLDDYNGVSDSAYSWNEIEKLCLEEAENDEEWKQEITEFWDCHLPVYFSVKSGYAYYALNTTGESGSIVHGYEPEFEETDIVTTSFVDFLDAIMKNSIEV
ncbi:SMI1/KNR4 family protein [Clostridium kluyveri]|uniref:SMI1/KNR4 family protein n=1 Tax=Clostridium kluyveri TaxID=1534 RepID=A0A1L5F8W6_CLOKL|nr:SMI1/KNR4 family protein [Clostridium kluyveri]APM39455.1 SMI1/KNR4 family protein [Clostridium kluyveri]UZQ50416.1 SMI1/KNR4 family protein [Clostridium kluyveri]